jgi:hypothetical protein
MATNTQKISAIQALVLGNSHEGNVSTKVIHLAMTSPVGVTILVKGRLAGSGRTFLPISYRKRYLNGAVGDDTFVSTTITDTSLIEVNAAGIDVELDCTGYTSGTITVDYVDLTG